MSEAGFDSAGRDLPDPLHRAPKHLPRRVEPSYRSQPYFHGFYAPSCAVRGAMGRSQPPPAPPLGRRVVLKSDTEQQALCCAWREVELDPTSQTSGCTARGGAAALLELAHTGVLHLRTTKLHSCKQEGRIKPP